MKSIATLGLVACAFALGGCGGSGGGSSTGLATRAAVLITDGPREDFAHVWATIYHVAIVPQSGVPVVLYDNTAGTQIDLKTLRDSSGQRFSFLGSAALPAGTYTAITVTIGPTVQLFRNGVAAGSPLAVSTTLPLDSSGHPIVTDTFASPKTITSGTNNLVLDFNLAHFVVTASNVLPVIEDGSTSGIDDSTRHNDGDYRGTISNLTGTAPVLSFTLTSSSGTATTVVTTASTAIYGTGTLANGNMVAVTGTLDTTTQNLVATQIEVCTARAGGGTPADLTGPRDSGTASALNATAGTFTLTTADADNFTLTATTVNVVTTAATLYYTDGGLTATQADFFTGPCDDAECHGGRHV